MEVWAGKIKFEDSMYFEDLHFFDARGSLSSLFPSDAKLLFLSIVEVAAIPLHLAAGPTLDIWTSNETTEKWLSESLLRDWKSKVDCNTESTRPWWLRPVQQSDRGILLGVEERTGSATGSERRVTEVLVYAALSQDAKGHASQQTPPGSLSPNAPQDIHDGTPNESTHDIKIHALPLCSTNSTLINIGGLASPPPSDNSSDVEARFLPPSLSHTLCASVSPRKRQRISTMFEDATHQRKRLMLHGGDRISKAMAAIDGAAITNEKLTNSTLEEDKDATRADQPNEIFRNEPSRGLLSRASSTSSFLGVESSRPPSSRGHLLNAKRSSLIRVESNTSMGRKSQISETSTIDQQNKSALTRIIMNGMRIYGLLQRKSMKPRIEPEREERPSRESSRLEEEEDEYKLIYHQTFKAASFAFRTHMSMEIINQEILRDVVDSFLVIFCNDPLASHTTNDPFCTESSKDGTSARKAVHTASTGVALPDTTYVHCVPLAGENVVTQITEGPRREKLSFHATVGNSKDQLS